MHSSFKALSTVVLVLSISACASITPKATTANEIRYAPAIDTTYKEVSDNINENVGLDVRWGGEIIDANKVGDVTELTVFAHPLSEDGRPLAWSDKSFSNGRFIVEVKDHDQSLIRKYVTVFGKVSGEKTLTNGPKSIVVPVVVAIESKEWSPEASNDKRGIAYYSLGQRTGHFNSFDRFNRHRSFSGFGHRGFSSFGRSFNGRGFHSGNRFGSRRSFRRGGFH